MVGCVGAGLRGIRRHTVLVPLLRLCRMAMTQEVASTSCSIFHSAVGIATPAEGPLHLCRSRLHTEHIEHTHKRVLNLSPCTLTHAQAYALRAAVAELGGGAPITTRRAGGRTPFYATRQVPLPRPPPPGGPGSGGLAGAELRLSLEGVDLAHDAQVGRRGWTCCKSPTLQRPRTRHQTRPETAINTRHTHPLALTRTHSHPILTLALPPQDAADPCDGLTCRLAGLYLGAELRRPQVGERVCVCMRACLNRCQYAGGRSGKACPYGRCVCL